MRNNHSVENVLAIKCDDKMVAVSNCHMDNFTPTIVKETMSQETIVLSILFFMSFHSGWFFICMAEYELVDIWSLGKCMSSMENRLTLYFIKIMKFFVVGRCDADAWPNVNR